MIGKLSKSESLRTVIEYVLKNDHSRLIACEGILVGDYHNEEWLEQMISDFEIRRCCMIRLPKLPGTYRFRSTRTMLRR